MTPISEMTRKELEARYKQTLGQRDALDEECQDLEDKLRAQRLELVQAAIRLAIEPDPPTPGATARLRRPRPSKPTPRRRVATPRVSDASNLVEFLVEVWRLCLRVWRRR